MPVMAAYSSFMPISCRVHLSFLPDTHVTAPTRFITDLMQLYRRWAASGRGLIATGNVMIDRRALGEPGNVRPKTTASTGAEDYLTSKKLRFSLPSSGTVSSVSSLRPTPVNCRLRASASR